MSDVGVRVVGCAKGAHGMKQAIVHIDGPTPESETSALRSLIATFDSCEDDGVRVSVVPLVDVIETTECLRRRLRAFVAAHGADAAEWSGDAVWEELVGVMRDLGVEVG